MKLIFGWAILFVLIPFSVLGQNVNTPGVPSLHVPEPSFQFETVESGQDVIHEYILQNKGTVPLKITRVKTG